jgi:hypothetical protein
MLTIELLEEALEIARRAGYHVRQEWLDGCAGGACIIKGQKWLFIDSTLSPREQLEEVLNVLWADADVAAIDLAPELREVAPLRKAA